MGLDIFYLNHFSPLQGYFLWLYLLSMNSRSKLSNTHCLFTLKTILIGHRSQNYVNKQWVLHNYHREFMLNKYDLCIEVSMPFRIIARVNNPS